jgi:hypothetical protein
VTARAIACTGWKAATGDRAQIDFSKMVSYQTQGRKLRWLGGMGLWCNTYNAYSFQFCPLTTTSTTTRMTPCTNSARNEDLENAELHLEKMTADVW